MHVSRHMFANTDPVSLNFQNLRISEKNVNFGTGKLVQFQREGKRSGRREWSYWQGALTVLVHRVRALSLSFRKILYLTNLQINM